jgi:hypothetical protein
MGVAAEGINNPENKSGENAKREVQRHNRENLQEGERAGGAEGEQHILPAPRRAWWLTPVIPATQEEAEIRKTEV